ncbi:MAG: hypothetical protein ACRC7G_16660, partial [Beijerinckiaceae bacterium]
GLIVIALALVGWAVMVRRTRQPNSALASTALIAAPVAARAVLKRLDFRTISVAGVIALGAILGRRLGR